MPGFHPGGEAEYTRRVLKTPLDVSSMLTFDLLDRRLGDFFGDYNNRPHSALNGMSPLEAWAADEHPLTKADRGTLLHAMHARSTRSVQHYGIEIRGHIYGGPAVAQLRKRNIKSVEVRYHQHDLDHIELFVDGTHEGTATRSQRQPEHQRLGVLSMRGKQRRTAENLIRAADYERVLDERERLREEGVDEDQWPALPAEPFLDEDTDGPLSDLSPSILGFGLSAPSTSNWSKRLDEAEAADNDLPTSTQKVEE